MYLTTNQLGRCGLKYAGNVRNQTERTISHTFIPYNYFNYFVRKRNTRKNRARDNVKTITFLVIIFTLDRKTITLFRDIFLRYKVILSPVFILVRQQCVSIALLSKALIGFPPPPHEFCQLWCASLLSLPVQGYIKLCRQQTCLPSPTASPDDSPYHSPGVTVCVRV